MKTFKEYLSKNLNEVNMANGDKNEKFGQPVDEKEDDLPPWDSGGDVKHIEHVNGHFIIHKKKGNKNTYHVTDHTGKIHMHLETKDKGKSEQVSILAASNKNVFPAHKLYHHLITNHNKILMSDTHQTYGGKKVWEKLSKEKGVGVHGWDGKKAHNLGNHLNHETEDETHTRLGNRGMDGHEEAKKMLLIAHKK